MRENGEGEREHKRKRERLQREVGGQRRVLE